jgi:hypothetical protein
MKVPLQPFVEKINVLLEQEGLNPLPDLFKHMVLAIFRKGPRTVENFIYSMEMAFAALVRYGHLTPSSNINNMQLTSTGIQQNRSHVGEPRTKSANFDAMLGVVRQAD